MRRLPQELAFPLGLGSKRQVSNSDGEQIPNNKPVTNNISAVGPAPDDVSNTREQYQDLDTINL